MKPVESSQHWNPQVTSWPSPKCLVDLIQVQKPVQVVATDQMPDHTYREASSAYIAISQMSSSGRSLV